MSFRIIVDTEDHAAVAGGVVGARAIHRKVTFDIEIPELETFIEQMESYPVLSWQILGVEWCKPKRQKP